jgi:hypothetical protein
MKKILIGALLASAFAVPTIAAEPTTPLRNDLRSDEAGVKNADSSVVTTEERIPLSSPATSAAPSSSTTVTVEPRSGASVTTGSSPTVATSALICSDTRLSAKEQADCSTDMLKAANADEQMTIQKRYEARLTQTPLRNDLKSNDAGVKNAVQPDTTATGPK